MPLYPLLVLEVGSGPQVLTFRNSTYLDPQVGLTRDLGSASTTTPEILDTFIISLAMVLKKKMLDILNSS
jgi:hypothetical protein